MLVSSGAQAWQRQEREDERRAAAKCGRGRGHCSAPPEQGRSKLISGARSTSTHTRIHLQPIRFTTNLQTTLNTFNRTTLIDPSRPSTSSVNRTHQRNAAKRLFSSHSSRLSTLQFDFVRPCPSLPSPTLSTMSAPASSWAPAPSNANWKSQLSLPKKDNRPQTEVSNLHWLISSPTPAWPGGGRTGNELAVELELTSPRRISGCYQHQGK